MAEVGADSEEQAKLERARAQIGNWREEYEQAKQASKDERERKIGEEGLLKRMASWALIGIFLPLMGMILLLMGIDWLLRKIFVRRG